MEQVLLSAVIFSKNSHFLFSSHSFNMSYLRSYVSWWLFMNTDISFGIDKKKKADHYSKTASETVAVSQTGVNRESFRDYFQWGLIHSRGFS